MNVYFDVINFKKSADIKNNPLTVLIAWTAASMLKFKKIFIR